MGIPLAVALLTILFHHHNSKSGSVSSILSARTSYKQDTETEDHHAQFGILQKTPSPYINSWIFGPHLHCNLPLVNANEITEVHLSPDIENIVSVTDIFEIVQSALHLHHLSNNLYDVNYDSIHGLS